MRKLIILLVVFQSGFLVTTQGQQNTITKDKWHWDNALKQDTAAGYVQVVKVDNVPISPVPWQGT